MINMGQLSSLELPQIPRSPRSPKSPSSSVLPSKDYESVEFIIGRSLERFWCKSEDAILSYRENEYLRSMTPAKWPLLFRIIIHVKSRANMKNYDGIIYEGLNAKPNLTLEEQQLVCIIEKIVKSGHI